MNFDSKQILLQLISHRDVLLQFISSHGRDSVLPKRVQKMCKDGTEKLLIDLALLNDCLTTMEIILFSLNGTRRTKFQNYYNFMQSAAELLKRRDKKLYGEYANLTANDCQRFLETHYTDRAPFGGANKGTQWMGLSMTVKLSCIVGCASTLNSYKRIFESTVLPLLDVSESISDVLELTGVWRVLNGDVSNQRNLANRISSNTPSAIGDNKFEIEDLNSSAILFDVNQHSSPNPTITLNSKHGAFMNGYSVELLLKAWAKMEASAWDRRKQMFEDIRSDWGRVARDLVQNESDDSDE